MYRDTSGKLYFADTQNHKIRMVDASGIITTVAGTGIAGDSGDGGPATSAQLDNPRGVHKDSSGNLYIADAYNHKIRKVDTSGDISTIAGTGSAGETGDGEAAILAEIDTPSDVLMDSSGNFFIADTNNHKIRQVDTFDDILTFVSNSGPGDDGDGGFAALAQLNKPYGMFKDPLGSLYIADRNNHKIRKVDLSTNIITTVAGTGSAGDTGDGGAATSAQLNEPRDMYKSAASGSLYIADTKNHKIRRVDTSGNMSTFAGTGSSGDGWDFSFSATTVPLDEPGDVLVSGSWLFISDTKNHKIRILSSWGWIWTFAGTGNAGSSGDGGYADDARLNEPRGIAIDSSYNIYIADKKNHKIRKVNTSDIITTVAGTGSSGYSGDGGLATDAKLDNPVDVFVDSSNNMYIVEDNGRRIRVVNAADGKIYTLAGTGGSGYNTDLPAVDTILKDPQGIAMDSAYGASRIFVSDTDNHKIKVLTLKAVYGL